MVEICFEQNIFKNRDFMSNSLYFNSRYVHIVRFSSSERSTESIRP